MGTEASERKEIEARCATAATDARGCGVEDEWIGERQRGTAPTPRHKTAGRKRARVEVERRSRFRKRKGIRVTRSESTTAPVAKVRLPRDAVGGSEARAQIFPNDRWCDYGARGRRGRGRGGVCGGPVDGGRCATETAGWGWWKKTRRLRRPRRASVGRLVTAFGGRAPPPAAASGGRGHGDDGRSTTAASGGRGHGTMDAPPPIRIGGRA